ncbi:MAG TPA: hypothetical protein VGT41_01415 [Candidatus Babeliales bacterium]|nr:hypothetical protein [Candidatus Babeliales bacterium]
MKHPIQQSIKKFLIISLFLTPFITKSAAQSEDMAEQEIQWELKQAKAAGYNASELRELERVLRQPQPTEPQATFEPSEIPSSATERDDLKQQEEEKERDARLLSTGVLRIPFIDQDAETESTAMKDEEETEEDPEMKAAFVASLTSAARDEEERKMRRYQDSLRAGSLDIIKILNRAQRKLNIAESSNNFPLSRIRAIEEGIKNLKSATPDTENLTEFITAIEDTINEEFEQGKKEAQEEMNLQNITRSMTDLGGMGYY